MKKRIWIVIKIVLAVLAFTYLFKSGRISPEKISELFALEHILYILAAAFCFILTNALAAFRLAYLLKTITVALTFTQSFKMTLIGLFFNSVVPGMTGGDLVKGYYLMQAEGETKGRSSGIVILDRVMGLSAIVTIAGFSTLYLLYKPMASLAHYEHALRIIAAAIISFCLLFLSFMVLASYQAFRDKIKAFSIRIFKGGILYRVLEGLGGCLSDRRALMKAFAISLVIQALTMIGIMTLALMLSMETTYILPLIVASSVVLLLGVVPVTPGNIGWTEIMGSVGWSLVGSSLGGIVFLYWRIIGLLCGALPGGLLYIAMNHKRTHLLPSQVNGVNKHEE